MFKDIRLLNQMLKRLKEQEDVVPTSGQFIKVLKEIPRFVELFKAGKEYFSDPEYIHKLATYELSLHIRMERGYY